MKMTIDIAEGVKYLHSLDPVIIHRDLKVQSLLYSSSLTVFTFSSSLTVFTFSHFLILPLLLLDCSLLMSLLGTIGRARLLI